jgi:hypothetical protein
VVWDEDCFATPSVARNDGGRKVDWWYGMRIASPRRAWLAMTVDVRLIGGMG